MDQIIKRSNEKFPIYANFQSVLENDEILDSYLLTCVNTLDGSNTKAAIVDSDEIVQSKVKIIIKAGANGNLHKISVQATTSLSNVYEKDILVIINDDPGFEFPKQPSEVTSFSVDFAKDLESGDHIHSVLASLCDIDGVDLTTEMVLDDTFSGTEHIVTVSGGENGQSYIIVLAITTHDGWVYSKAAIMRIEET